MVKLVTAPTAEPLTLAEVRIHLRQGADDPSALENFEIGADDDSWVLAKIAAARADAEDFLGYPLTNGLYVMPAASFEAMALPDRVTVDRIEYLDAANASQTLSTARYYFDPYGSGLTFEGTLPTLSSRPNAVQVYLRGNPGLIDERIKHAMCLLIGHWHQNREATVFGAASEMPMSVEYLLRPLRLRLGMA